MQEDRDLLLGLARSLGVPPREIGARIEKLQKEMKDLRKRPAAGAAQGFDPLGGEPVEGGAYAVRVHVVSLPREAVAAPLEAFVKKPGDAAAVLVVTTDDGKVTALAAGNPAAVAKGFDATTFLRATGGKGGGKPHLAQGTFPGGAPTLDDLRAKAAAAAR
jgi:alanyl-tRNA synthetase